MSHSIQLGPIQLGPFQFGAIELASILLGLVLVLSGCGDEHQRDLPNDIGADNAVSDGSGPDGALGDGQGVAPDADNGFDLGGQPPTDTSNPPTDTSNPPADAGPVNPPPGDGCGQAATMGKTWTLQYDGRSRAFQVHLPPTYDPNTPTPVVLNYHGRAMTGDQQALMSQMNEVADDNGFIVVYPEGTGTLEQTWNGGYCCGSAQATNVNDVGFTGAVLDALEADLCIDTGRVYATGISNGGFMTHRLGCELADRITAFGAVAGPLGMFDCTPVRPIPMIHFHGTADTIVPYNGYLGQVSAPGSAETWAQLNGCGGSSTVYLQQGDVTCEQWTGCEQNAEVRLCTVDGGGHTWPGGETAFFGALGYTTQHISASAHFWEFVSGYSL